MKSRIIQIPLLTSKNKIKFCVPLKHKKRLLEYMNSEKERILNSCIKNPRKYINSNFMIKKIGNKILNEKD